MKVEAKGGVRLLQTQQCRGCQQPPEVGEVGRILPYSVQREKDPVNTLISDL